MTAAVLQREEATPAADLGALILAAADRERRQLERNLHDGAQQRLVALGLRLGLVASRLQRGSEAEQLLSEARGDLAEALRELRDLAHGLHPAVLSDRGLVPALEDLAARATAPVTLEVRVPQRPPAAVEIAAYYVISEALANVAKYADATSVDIRVVRHRTHLEISVVDDGAGGADPSRGSGLAGLAARVESLGGRLELESPLGEGTALRVTLPLQAAVERPRHD